MTPPPPNFPHEDLIAEALRQVNAATPAARASGSPFSDGPGADPAISRDAFPGYEIYDEVHRGGQGVVYRAINKATGRKVAIKVLRTGPFADEKDLIRFEKEVEILAHLNHPNIVAVQDKGSAGGLHFFVMDYISGKPLDAYLKETGRGIEDVLALFTKVCDAVNAAHLKGVIHRDLKPSNIRVDERGEPHILDFGLAKIAASNAEAAPEAYRAMTLTGQFIGSLFWASPEQAEGSVAKIDVRTDVYSIGVMLYHALTGHFPYNVLGTMHEVLGNILRAAPARPSTVRRQINDEVETIILKCLSKERDRRYQNAGELARDLRNYLTGRAIEAKRDSGWYVIRKTLGRHRPVVFTATVVLVSLLGTGIVSTTAWRRTVRALEAQTAAEAARGAALDESRIMLVRAQQQSLALQRLIRATDPEGTGDPGAAKVLLGAVRQWLSCAERELAGDPATLDAVTDLCGRVLINAGVYDDEGGVPGAKTLIQRALVNRRERGESADVARSLVSLSSLRWELEDYAGGRAAAEEALGLLAGLTDPERAVPGVTETEADASNFLGLNLDRAGRRAEAREQFAKAHADRVLLFGAGSVPAAEVLCSWGRSLLEDGRVDAAIEKLSEAEAALGGVASASTVMDSSGVLRNVARGNLVDALVDRGGPGDGAKAVPIARAALDSYTGFYGTFDPDHPMLAVGNNKLGRALLAAGDAAAAIPHFREAVRIREATAGAAASMGHLGRTRMNLAMALGAAGRRDEADTEFAAAAKLLDAEPSRASWATCHYQWARLMLSGKGIDDWRRGLLLATAARAARAADPSSPMGDRVDAAIVTAHLTLLTGGRAAATDIIGEIPQGSISDEVRAARLDVVRGLCAVDEKDHRKAVALLLPAHGVLAGIPAAGYELTECRRGLREALVALGRAEEAAQYE